MKKKGCVILIFLALLTVALASGSALAALGGPVDSVESDRTALSAVRRSVTPGPTYTVHEIAYDGTTVREYVSPEGIVFAIAWNGNRSPDLRPFSAHTPTNTRMLDRIRPTGRA